MPNLYTTLLLNKYTTTTLKNKVKDGYKLKNMNIPYKIIWKSGSLSVDFIIGLFLGYLDLYVLMYLWALGTNMLILPLAKSESDCLEKNNYLKNNLINNNNKKKLITILLTNK